MISLLNKKRENERSAHTSDNKTSSRSKYFDVVTVVRSSVVQPHTVTQNTSNTSKRTVHLNNLFNSLCILNTAETQGNLHAV